MSGEVATAEVAPPPPLVPVKPPYRNQRRPLRVLIFVAVAVAIPTVLLSVLLAATLLVRASQAGSTTSSVEEVTLGLEGLTSGCLELAQPGHDASVCLDDDNEALRLDVSHFQPGSNLTVTGSTGDNVVLSVDADGTAQVELGANLRSAPIVVSGVLTDGRQAVVTVELTDTP